MKLSIIIPVFNEEKTLQEILTRVGKIKLSKVQKEIIVIDDGSTDNSYKILKKYKDLKIYRHKMNRGKGAAVRTGISKATGDVILIQDADLEYDPVYYQKLLEPIVTGRAKVVYGSRLKNFPLRISGSRKTPLITHFLGNKLLTFCTNILYRSRLTDMETCYKVFSAEVIKGIELESERFNIEPEITAKLLKAGVQIKEVPIKVLPRGYLEGKKITWKDGFSALYTLLKYRI